MRRKDSPLEEKSAERQAIEDVVRFGTCSIVIRVQEWRQAQQLFAIRRTGPRRYGLARTRRDVGEILARARGRAAREIEPKSKLLQETYLPFDMGNRPALVAL